MTDSCGSRSNNARATVSPPIPESNTPSGALFMEWNGDADAARECADFEIRWEVAQMGRDVRLRAREQMIENPQHEPVLHFLPLEAQVCRVDRLEVIRFLLRLERHHGRDPFPGHERRPGHRPVGRRLPPPRKNEGAQKRDHGPDAAMNGTGRQDHVSRIGLSRVLTCKSAGRHDCKQTRKSDRVPTCQRADVHSYRATRTFKRPRSSSTVHSLTPGSRSSPSTCSTSGSSASESRAWRS